MEQVLNTLWTIGLLGLRDKTSEDMTQVNVKGRGKRSEVETLECTGSCNGEDQISYLLPPTASQKKESPSCEIHIPKAQISSCFSTTESTCLQQDSSLLFGEQPKQDRKVK